MYHQVSAVIPDNTTLSDRTEREHSHMSDGIFTLYHARCQGTYTCAAAGTVTGHHKSGQEAPILGMGSELFVRHY